MRVLRSKHSEIQNLCRGRNHKIEYFTHTTMWICGIVYKIRKYKISKYFIYKMQNLDNLFVFGFFFQISMQVIYNNTYEWSDMILFPLALHRDWCAFWWWGAYLCNNSPFWLIDWMFLNIISVKHMYLFYNPGILLRFFFCFRLWFTRISTHLKWRKFVSLKFYFNCNRQ